MIQFDQQPAPQESIRGDLRAPQPRVNDISEWVNWMRRELPAGGIELPGEETSSWFAAWAISVASRVDRLCPRYFPPSLRTNLIEAAIVHQCWKHRADLQKRLRAIAGNRPGLGIDRATVVVRECHDGYSLMEAADGRTYIVKFPKRYGETALATEIVCLELARQMGLPVPTAKVILVSDILARHSGLTVGGWAGARSRGGVLRCLGLTLDFEELKMAEPGKPRAALTQRTRRYLIGKVVFDILTLNLAAKPPAFRDLNGHAEPVFMDHARCLADADWPRFLRATYWERFSLPRSANNVTSFDQLQPWIRRARNIDFDPIWELAFTLPAEWYGEERTSITSVLHKLDERARNLLRSIVYLVETGSFPNIKDLGPVESEVDSCGQLGVAR
jgi:HipA-like kinase